MKRRTLPQFMRQLAVVCMLCCGGATAASTVVTDEGAWCWFADPRALHYENADGTINATWLGHIDVHGNVKATQYDWLSGRKTDVLVRSYFQPDDHNNPTFLVLPDERDKFGYTELTLQNSVKVILKQTDLKKDQVLLMVTLLTLFRMLAEPCTIPTIPAAYLPSVAMVPPTEWQSFR